MVLDVILSTVYNNSMDSTVGTLPPEIISRLNTEAIAEGALSQFDTANATTAQMRAYAAGRLNAMTPKALTSLNHLLSSTEPKVQMTAISKLLDLAPGTKPLDARVEAQLTELPESAISAIAVAFTAFAKAFIASSPASPDLIVTVTKEETPTKGVTYGP